MHVVKRDGRQAKVSFDKITERIAKMCFGLNEQYLVPEKIAQKVVEGVYDGVHTSELDNLAAETCAYMSQMHPDFSLLAARIAISNLQKMTGDRWAISNLQKMTGDKLVLESGRCSFGNNLSSFS